MANAKMKIPQQASYTWKGILKIRPKVIQGFNVVIGNGSDTYFWLDPWLDTGPICQSSTSEDIEAAGSSWRMKVEDTVQNGVIVWPSGDSNVLRNLRQQHPPPLSDARDMLTWKVEQFTVKSVAGIG